MITQLAARLLFSLTLLLLVSSGYSCRAEDPFPLVYRLTADVLLQECHKDGTKVAGSFHTAPNGANFTIVNSEKHDGGYTIKFSRWNVPMGLTVDLRMVPHSSTDQTIVDMFYNLNDSVNTPRSLTSTQRQDYYDSYYFDLNYDATTGEERYFLISTEQLAASAEPLAPKFIPIGGTLVIPFKYRSQHGGDFTKDITISGMGGIAHPINRSNDASIGGMLGIGITSVTLTKDNSTLTETQDRAALTFSIAALGQWKKLQLGIVGGWDILGAGSGTWDYNKKFWLGGGIGFNIFKPDNATAKDASTNSGNKKK